MIVIQTVDRLEDLLQRIRSRSAASPQRREAQTFLETLSPPERIDAEHQLLEAGFAPEDLQPHCTAYLTVFEDSIDSLKQSLPPGHVVRTLIQEHEQILKLLDELEILNEVFQQVDSITPGELKLIECTARHLLGSGSHHQREEQVLFAALAQQGLAQPPQLMQAEHEELRVRQQALLEVALTGTQVELEVFKTKLNTIARALILSLRNHILKENSILYPTALRMFSEAEWQQMKQDCDRIGYCSFTPSN